MICKPLYQRTPDAALRMRANVTRIQHCIELTTLEKTCGGMLRRPAIVWRYANVDRLPVNRYARAIQAC
jgi:hypothetical protein